jgi:hypothetical protein
MQLSRHELDTLRNDLKANQLRVAQLRERHNDVLRNHLLTLCNGSLQTVGRLTRDFGFLKQCLRGADIKLKEAGLITSQTMHKDQDSLNHILMAVCESGEDRIVRELAIICLAARFAATGSTDVVAFLGRLRDRDEALSDACSFSIDLVKSRDFFGHADMYEADREK